MKVLFYQSHSGNNKGVYLATIGNHLQYVNRHDYSILLDNAPYSAFADFQKLKRVLAGFEMLVTLGSDCVFTNVRRRIEDFLPEGKDFGICIEGRGYSYLNGEILMIRNTPGAMDLLDQLDNIQKAYPDAQYGTQSVIGRIVSENWKQAERIYLIPAGELQTYAERSERFTKFRWKDGDFLAHAVGGDNAGKEARCRVLAEKIRNATLVRKTSVKTVVLTPTGDRPVQLGTVADCIGRQTLRPDLWLIADDGKTSVPREITDRAGCPVEVLPLPPMDGNSLRRNFTALLDEAGKRGFPEEAVCAVFEDDDFYPAGYLAHIAGILQKQPACGSVFRRYFQLSSSRFREFRNDSFGCLHSTAFRASEIPRIRPLAAGQEPSGVDVRIWQAWGGNCVCDFGDATPVGLKEWPSGRPGIMNAHRPHEGDGFTGDPGSVMLYDWMGAEMALHYRSLFKPDPEFDVVIPLGGGSCSGNDELRIAFRSIERYTRARTVWLVTDCAPDWVRNVRIIPVPDRHKHNKDANLFDKLLAAAYNPDLAETFVFLSDDQCFLTRYNPDAAPVVYNVRGPEDFRNEPDGIWTRRMLNTFTELERRGIHLKCNYDAHTPVAYRKTDFIRAMKEVEEYEPVPGFCINTLICGVLKRMPEIRQNVVKFHSEGAPVTGNGDGKLFAGFNDAGWKAGMREALFSRFPEKSKFEK